MGREERKKKTSTVQTEPGRLFKAILEGFLESKRFIEAPGSLGRYLRSRRQQTRKGSVTKVEGRVQGR